MSYDEEQRLIQIQRDFGGGNIQTAYQYAYAYDGGRRWRKDYTQNQWTWYPCGVACSAGELIESQSDLNGINWTVTAQYLKPGSCGGAIVRRNSEFHLWDLTGTAQVITDGNGAILANDLYDQFGVKRFASGSAATPWRTQEQALAEESMLGVSGPDTVPAREVELDRVAQIPKTWKCTLPKPPIAGHTHWCSACGQQCVNQNCQDPADIDCVLECSKRQKKCLQDKWSF